MVFNGKSPNGLNQVSASVISLNVSGSSVFNASSGSLNVFGGVTGSSVQTNIIGTPNNGTLQLKANTQITGSLAVSSTISGSTIFANNFVGDGSGITNIPASAVGDIDRLKSGSAQAIISPNRGLEINAGVTIRDYLIVLVVVYLEEM